MKSKTAFSAFFLIISSIISITVLALIIISYEGIEKNVIEKSGEQIISLENQNLENSIENLKIFSEYGYIKISKPIPAEIGKDSYEISLLGNKTKIDIRGTQAISKIHNIKTWNKSTQGLAFSENQKISLEYSPEKDKIILS